MKFSAALLTSFAACLFSSAVARDARFASIIEARQNQAAAAKKGGNNGGSDPQKSLTLDPSVINSNLAKTGQEGATEAGQVASLTTTNNFINFCVGKTLTNGQQVKGGSCNSVPMGDIPSATKMPSGKFLSPTNLSTMPANKAFTVQLQVKNMDTGHFVNPATNYFGAPQQLNAQGIIIAHSHIVIEEIDSLGSTKVLDPSKFAFFQGLNAPANKNGVLTATVTNGLPAGVYRIASINTSANHTPVSAAVAQHGSLDDMVYITVSNSGGNGGKGGKGGKTRRTSSRDGKARL